MTRPGSVCREYAHDFIRAIGHDPRDVIAVFVTSDGVELLLGSRHKKPEKTPLGWVPSWDTEVVKHLWRD